MCRPVGRAARATGGPAPLRPVRSAIPPMIGRWVIMNLPPADSIRRAQCRTGLRLSSRREGQFRDGILHHITDSERPEELTETLCRALPSGSYVFIHHLLDSGDAAIADVQAAFREGLGRGQFRTWAQVTKMFSGLELVEPGLVLVPEWRPDAGTPSARDLPVLRLACAGVARKP